MLTYGVQWLVINSVAGAGLLFDACDGKLPLIAAIVIILIL